MQQPSRRPPSLATHAGYLAFQVGKATNRLLTDALAEHGVRPTHLAVMAALADLGPACQRELCDVLDTDKSHMVAFVDDLESDGLVARDRDPDDRRRHRVALTDAGTATLQRLLAVQQACEEELFGALPAARHATLVELLAEVVRHADAVRLDAQPSPGRGTVSA